MYERSDFMAELWGLFDDDDREYSEKDFWYPIALCFRSGIEITEDGSLSYEVTKNNGSVTVAPGKANIMGYFTHLTASKVFAVATPTNYARIDRVVVRLDKSVKKCSVELKSGVPASNPQPPSLQRDNIRYELSLAQVKITITGNITVIDERSNKSLCGGIRPNGMTEFESWFSQVQTAVESWFRTQQGTGWRQIWEINEGEPFPENAEVGALCRVYKK